MSNNTNAASQQEIAQRLMKALTRSDDTEAKEYIDEAFSRLSADDQLTKVPEHIFRQVFWPYISGEKVPTEEENPLAHWRGLLTSPTDPAEVVDPSGKTLFIVPPLYDTTRLDTRKKGPRRLDRIFDDFSQEVHTRRRLAVEEHAQNLAKEAVDIRERVSGSKYSWEPVLQFYGLLDKKVEETIPQVDSVIAPDEFNFD